ncbi:hypothetical protein ACOSP7_012948 [Xanthoceras sorbifolium]
MLGDMCKVDPITESQAKDRFARNYVEIDVSQPLRGTLNIDERRVRVEYESVGLICFNCGKIEHGKDRCKEGLHSHQEEETSKESAEDPQPTSMLAYYSIARV